MEAANNGGSLFSDTTSTLLFFRYHLI